MFASLPSAKAAKAASISEVTYVFIMFIISNIENINRIYSEACYNRTLLNPFSYEGNKCIQTKTINSASNDAQQEARKIEISTILTA